MKKMLLSILTLSIFVSCSITPDGKDENGFFYWNKRCVEYNTETYTGYMYINGIMYPMPQTRTVCTEMGIVKVYIPENRINKSYLKGYKYSYE